MKITLRNFVLFLLMIMTFSSCFFRKHPDKKWAVKRHHKFFYHKGNNYGGRKLWVRVPHYGRSLY
jgi:hypothetical protein